MTSFFNGLSEKEVENILSVTETVSRLKGETIIEEGAEGDALYIISEGSAVVTKRVGKGEVEVLSEMESGEFFGEMSLLEGEIRSASVTALDDCELLKIEKRAFDEFTSKEPLIAAKVYRNFAMALSSRLRNSSDRVKSLAKEGRDTRNKADRSISEMLAIVSHELRTPVAVIKGAAETLDEFSLTKEAEDKLVSTIRKHTEHLAKLFEDINHLNELQISSATIEKTPTDVRKMVDAVVAELNTKASAKNIKVALSLPKDLADIPVHEAKIKRAFGHLLDNAIKFTGEQGNVAITAEVNKDKKVLTFSIKDSGPGIPENIRGEMFKCFAQGASSMSTERKSGLGLGLPLAKNLVAAHGGDLWFECPKSGGTIFYFSLPME